MAETLRNKKRLSAILGGLVFLAFVIVVIALHKFYEFEKPQISLTSDTTLIGSGAEIKLGISDEKSGIQEVSVFIVQGQKRFSVHQRTITRESYLFRAGPAKLEENFAVDGSALGFDEGRADILVVVRDFSFWRWMKGNESTTSFPVVLDTKAPRIWVVNSPEAMRPGSSGIVVYRVSEPVGRNGVEIDGFFHPGFPVPARGDDMYGAMIALPYDAEAVKSAQIQAYDMAGNLASVAFGINLRRVEKNSDRINVTESFLQSKMPEFSQYYPEMLELDTLLDQYLYVNSKVRDMNADRIREICAISSPERLWDDGPFKRMRRSSRRAGFADYRSYYFDDKKIDEQVHLGVDLASVRQAEVEAENRGRVVFADYLGIYGNMVIIDHGLGVFTLYSHMSQIIVKEEDMVEKGAILGNTGTSGMAGGDHLHFSVLVNGIFVNPIEWWDKNWLDLHIMNHLTNFNRVEN